MTGRTVMTEAQWAVYGRAPGSEPPTPALLAAVLPRLTDGAHAQLARDAFAYGIVAGMDLPADVSRRLTPYFANFDAEAHS